MPLPTCFHAGALKSTYHRVRAPTKDDPTHARYSIPYFFNPRLNFAMQVGRGGSSGAHAERRRAPGAVGGGQRAPRPRLPPACCTACPVPLIACQPRSLAPQGPKKRWGPITGFDILSKTGA